METDWLPRLVLLIVLLISSAFFSGTEVALFSINKKKLDANFNKESIIYRFLAQLISAPRRLLVTILIGNTLVNVGASIVAVSLAFSFSSSYRISIELTLLIQIVLLTLLVLIFGELLPKVVASKNPIAFSKVIAFPLYFISTLIYPVSELLTELIRSLSKKLKITDSKTALSKEELGELATVGRERGTIEDDEHSLISSIVNFGRLTVNDVMTPRVDMIAVSDEDKYEDLIKIITDSGHSRIPVYKNDLDEIIGIVYAKDLLKFVKDPSAKSDFSISKLLKKALFVPKSKLISELLNEFREMKLHIAIVVDEYGGTSGLISLEDIIEEVIGDIWDEFDKEEDRIFEVDKNKFIALGKIKLDEMNDKLGITFDREENDYDTLGGFIFNQAGNVPKEGFSFILDGIKFTVKEIQKKRVKKVLIEDLREIN